MKKGRLCKNVNIEHMSLKRSNFDRVKVNKLLIFGSGNLEIQRAGESAIKTWEWILNFSHV